jgi:hypothetical protein
VINIGKTLLNNPLADVYDLSSFDVKAMNAFIVEYIDRGDLRIATLAFSLTTEILALASRTSEELFLDFKRYNGFFLTGVLLNLFCDQSSCYDESDLVC